MVVVHLSVPQPDDGLESAVYVDGDAGGGAAAMETVSAPLNTRLNINSTVVQSVKAGSNIC